jgi:diguanylate cyclase (GGDEF)-like protein
MTNSKKTNSLKSLSAIGISDIIGTGIVAFFWFYLATLMDAATYGELHYFIAIAANEEDDFKQINDTHGHLAGDIVLQILSEIVRENLRKNDIFIRWGGEEFIIIPKDVKDILSAQKIAEYLRKKIENANFMEVEKVTCSFGVACKTISTKDDIKTLFKNADSALYEAKNNGKNQVKVFE